jgi:FkbM family methyltransferase
MRPFKNLFKNLLGENNYQRMSQQLRPFKLLVHPKYDKEVQALPRIIHPGDTAIDIGANYGQYTRILSKCVFPGGRVFAFEPCSATFKGLQRTCRWLRLKNVIPVQTALSRNSGNSILRIPIKHDGTHGVSLAYTGTDMRRDFIEEKIATVSLDEFSAKNNIHTLAFIKCDVEGAELQVLRGAEKTLKQWRPAILLEVNIAHLARHQDTPEDLEKFMTGMGYHFFKWENETFKKMETIADTFGTANYFLMTENNF